MKAKIVKDMMVPLEDYATISHEAVLYEAIMALEEAQRNFDQQRYRHRAILVHNDQNNIVGKLSQLDILRVLEPGYKQAAAEMEPLSHWELSPDLARAMMTEHALWQTPLEDICRKATEIKVKDIMYTPIEGEYVEENTSLEEAIHQLVVGHHQSLLVTRDQAVVGILRLTDLFKEISIIINTCDIASYKKDENLRILIPTSSVCERQDVNVQQRRLLWSKIGP